MSVINLVEKGRSPLHDVPHMLRSLADQIAEGAYGDTSDPEHILRVTCVLRASQREPIVLGFGATADANQAFVDLHAGAAQILAMAHPGRD